MPEGFTTEYPDYIKMKMLRPLEWHDPAFFCGRAILTLRGREFKYGGAPVQWKTGDLKPSSFSCSFVRFVGKSYSP